MSEFQETLRKLITRVEGNMPPRYTKIMHASTRALEKSGQATRIPQPGAELPPFEMPNQHAAPVRSADLLSRGPLVLTFYRGFWCSYCNADLRNLERYRERIEAAGATLLAVSPEQVAYSRKIIRTQKLGFDILWDARNDYAGRVGLRFSMPQDLKQLYRENFNINLQLYHGDDDWTLPLPARFVIDGTGVIRYSEACADYRRRPDPDEVLDSLGGLG